MSLQNGTEIISLAFLINRATGIYGVIALLTGYSMTALQLSMYIFSILFVVLLFLLIPHIRKQSPFQNLALAYLYMLDTAVNTAYTTSFFIAWYMAGLDSRPEHDGDGGSKSPVENPGDGRDGGANDTSARWSMAEGGSAGGGNSSHGGSGSGSGGAGDSKMQVRETAISMVTIVALTVVRFYFAVVVAAHARSVLHRYSEGRPRRDTEAAADGSGKGGMGNPFAKGSPEGEGWKGRLGRAMVSIGADYWLTRKEDEEWARDVGAKFRSSTRGQDARHRQEQPRQDPEEEHPPDWREQEPQVSIQGGATTSTDARAFRI